MRGAHDVPIEVRPATVGDAPGIAQLKGLVWPEKQPAPDQVRAALCAPGHATFVAIHAGAVIGFVDGFGTISEQGLKRWEVDLLAVRPGFRGKGFGERLLRACTAAGRSHGQVIARALIHTENGASQRSFARCGYGAQESLCRLYVLPRPENAELRALSGWYMIAVSTLSYRGLWLEAPVSAAVPHTAYEAPAGEVWELAGAVIPVEQPQSAAAVQTAGFRDVGTYRWWVLELDRSA